MKKRILNSLGGFGIGFCLLYVAQRVQVLFETREAIAIWRCIVFGCIVAIMIFWCSQGEDREH